MSRFNTVTLVGNLTRDPELRYTPNGAPIVNFGLAVSRSWQSDTGQRSEETNFFDVTAWNRLGENCAESLQKGDRVIATGRLNWRSWESADGVTRTKVDIVADSVGPSLEWATVKITKNPKAEFTASEPPIDDVGPAENEVPF